MHSHFSRLRHALLALLLAPLAEAADLQALDVVSLPGDRLELQLTFDGPVPVPRGYSIEQPARIALDLPGVRNRLGSRQRELGVGNARSLVLVETPERTRLILNLLQALPYGTRREGNRLIVTLGAQSGPAARSGDDAPPASAPAAAVPPPGAPAPAATPAVTPSPAVTLPARTPVVPVQLPDSAAPARALRSLDFRRGEQGAGSVLIGLSDPSLSPRIEEAGGRIVLDFPEAALPEGLRQRLDVRDFATPVQFIEARAVDGRARIIIEPGGRYDYLAYQSGTRLVVNVKPLAAEDAGAAPARERYSGERLSLNFQDIEVRAVLQLLAEFTGLNLVASDSVQGTITLRLHDLPWDQALDLVLRSKGLDRRMVGNVLLVAPASEIAERERQELESRQQLAELAPLRREVVQLNYASASEIARLFEEFSSGGEQKDLRGSVIFDDRTNSLIVHLTEERLAELRRIVAQLDVPVRQVMIEARIVEANVGYDKSLGVRWGGNLWTANDSRWRAWGKDGNLDVVEDPNAQGKPGDDDYVPSRRTARFDGIPQIPVNTPFIDLGAPGSTAGIGLGFITDNTILDLQLSAMEKTGNGEVVSQPKVVTSDKETAKILKGSEVPYQEASSSGATSTSFKEAALSLEVTPQITPDNRIVMEVLVTKDEPDFSKALNGVPPIKKNAVNAKVLVTDGETIVIGGVFSNTQSKSVEKVPLLGDIPFIGRLFRRDIVSDQKSELLVFLTPRIMDTQAFSVSR